MALSLEQMKANRKLWADALESGEYQQGRERLRRGDQYCCLGVLSALAGCQWDAQAERYDKHYSFAPERAKEFVGLADMGGDFGKDCSLTAENDRGTPFAGIAAIIRAEPEGLFIDPEAA